MTYGLRISASVYMYMYIKMAVTFCPRWPHRCKMASLGYLWMPSSKLVVHEESESWTSLPHSFTKEGLLTACRLVEFGYLLYKQRYERWTQKARSSDANVSFNHY